jgi:hypothetical protein
MACAGCGAKYKGVSIARRRLNLPVKYPKTRKPSKAITPAPIPLPKKVNAEEVIQAMSTIISNV